MEATYYKIPELQAALTEDRFVANFFRMFGGKNPFDAVNETAKRARTLLITLTTLSATGATVAIQRDWESFLKFIGWRKEEEDDNDDKTDKPKKSGSKDAKLAPA